MVSTNTKNVPEIVVSLRVIYKTVQIYGRMYRTLMSYLWLLRLDGESSKGDPSLCELSEKSAAKIYLCITCISWKYTDRYNNRQIKDYM